MSPREVMSLSTIVLIWSALWFGLGVLLMDFENVIDMVRTLIG